MLSKKVRTQYNKHGGISNYKYIDLLLQKINKVDHVCVCCKHLLAAPECGTLSQRVGETCRHSKHQNVTCPQVANFLFLDANVTQLCEIQHN